MKTRIFNLIILDESGSMSCVKRQTIDGCNETINTIITAQKQHTDTQDHFVSIYAFQGDGSRPSRYIIKNAAANDAHHITPDDYEPWGTTPLNDAVGSTLIDLKTCTDEFPQSIGSVTIITDGYENASRHYSRKQVASMIQELKNMGWNFNFIGANIDVVATAATFAIDNTLEFKQDEEGTRQMFETQSQSRMNYYDRIDECMADNTAPRATFAERAAKASKGFFKK